MIKRILLGGLVLVLLVLSVPPLRQRAQPAIDTFYDLVGWTVEGPLAPAVNPYRELEAQATIGKVVREMVRDRNSGFVRPDGEELEAYMGRKLPDESFLDPWGTPYALRSDRDSVAVISAGPDMVYDTEDDIAEKIRYGEPSESRRPRRR